MADSSAGRGWRRGRGRRRPAVEQSVVVVSWCYTAGAAVRQSKERANGVGGSQAGCIQPTVQYGKLPSTMVRSRGAGRVLFGCSLTPRREAPRSRPALWQFWQSWQSWQPWQSLVLYPRTALWSGTAAHLSTCAWRSSQPAPPAPCNLAPAPALICQARHGTRVQDTRLPSLPRLLFTATPYMCRLFTEAALGSLSHVRVLSSP